MLTPDFHICYIDFLWAEGLDKYVYPHILELLESHSFNGHISTDKDKERSLRRSASNGAGTVLREIKTLVRELEGNESFDDDDGRSSAAISALNTPNRSPLVERHSFISSRRTSSSRLATHSFINGQEQQQQSK